MKKEPERLPDYNHSPSIKLSRHGEAGALEMILIIGL
jgi:hypothetical protein